jgi:hypothetical protein
MSIIVARIHNNSLRSCQAVDSIEDGKNLVKELAECHFRRDLTEEEMQEIEDTMSIYNDLDADNIVTFAVGIVE